MNTKLYQQLFNKLDSLGVIRKDLIFGCEVISDGRKLTMVGDADYENYITSNGSIEYNYYVFANEDGNVAIDKIIGHPPVLSDAYIALDEINYNAGGEVFDDGIKNEIWSLWNGKPLLSEQSDELGEYLLTLLG